MRFLFKSKAPKALLVPVLSSLQSRVEAWHRTMATRLTHVVQRMSAMQKWVVFVLFCVVFGGGSTMCLMAAFRPGTHQNVPAEFTVPAYVTPKTTPMPRSTDFSPSELTRLFSIERYVDSLKRTGSPVYDSLTRRNSRFESDYAALKEILQLYKSK